MGLFPCHGQAGNQDFGLTDLGEMMFDDDLCLDVPSQKAGSAVVIYNCHGMGGNQKWSYSMEVSVKCSSGITYIHSVPLPLHIGKADKISPLANSLPRGIICMLLHCPACCIYHVVTSWYVDHWKSLARHLDPPIFRQPTAAFFSGRRPVMGDLKSLASEISQIHLWCNLARQFLLLVG